jgi:radical SAM superfamily enzyme YgiQ (UPF0313 family)
MRVLMVLPALAEAKPDGGRPIKYSLFPPLGLAQLAAFLPDDAEVRLVDEHVMDELPTDRPPAWRPDLVVVQAYITSADRAHELCDFYRNHGITVCLGGLHPTSLPEEARPHCDHLFLGPGDAIFPAFLADLAAGRARALYDSRDFPRDIAHLPPPRRALIDRSRYLVPNSLIVTRGCPHRCDFCYKEAFFDGGRSFYTQAVDAALAEIDRLPGRHLYFLDDHLLGNPHFARALFAGMRGAGRRFQAAGTVDSVLRGDLIERAADAGLRSLFVGFETLGEAALRGCGKRQNVGRDYDRAIRRLHDLGVMVNASFVFGLDGDGPDVFDRTVDWAIDQSIETATFHVATPYPGTGFFSRIEGENRLLHRDWRRYDTRQTVFRPSGMTPAELEAGYRRAYRAFYTWPNVARGAWGQQDWPRFAKHLAYAGGWKRAAPIWAAMIRNRKLAAGRRLLETVLARPQQAASHRAPAASLPVLDAASR